MGASVCLQEGPRVESGLFGGMRREHTCTRKLDSSHTEGKAGDVKELEI